MIDILLAEDHQVVRTGIKLLLTTDRRFNITAEAGNGQHVLDLLDQNNNIDIVLTACDMPATNGLALLREIKVRHEKVKLVFLSVIDDVQYIADLMQNGANGYMLKNADVQELMFAIEFIHNGGRYVSASLAVSMLENLPEKAQLFEIKALTAFTSREIEILNFIAEGITTHEIADRLFISKRTVEGHKQSLLNKTGSRNTAVLIKNAVMWNLI